MFVEADNNLRGVICIPLRIVLRLFGACAHFSRQSSTSSMQAILL